MITKRLLSIHRFILPLSLALAGCGVDPESAPEVTVDDEVSRLAAELAKLPGELVLTRFADMPFSEEMRAKLVTADKVLHVYSDGSAAAFTATQERVPEGVPQFRVFREIHGDIVIAKQERLPEYLRQQDPRKPSDGTSEAVGLPVGTGALWPGSTVAYTIDSTITDAGELAGLRQAITSWNTSVDPSGNPLKVRYVPRYWGDNRPYVVFTRATDNNPDTTRCAASMVGRHDTVFTNAFSHNIWIYPNCFTEKTIHHEMAHTAGLFHEQQRCDRDSFVDVHQPLGVDCERLCGGNSQHYGPYNYLSLMHYPYQVSTACKIFQITPPAGASFRGTPGQVNTATRLDAGDVAAINQMYFGAASLPPIGSSRFFSLVPQFTTKVLAVGASSVLDGTQLILWEKLSITNQQFIVLDDVEGYVQLRPRHAPWKCIEVGGFSTVNGGPITQRDCNNAVNQKWIIAPTVGALGLFDIINKNSGLSIDVTGWSNGNGTPIQQWTYLGGTNQRFSLAPAF